MEIFLAGIMQGSMVELAIHPQDWREAIKELLARHVRGASVYCHFSRHPNSVSYDLPDIRRTLAEGLERARRCDLLIAYLPAASMGTAVEMHEAYRSGAMILAVTPLSSNWVVRAYSDRVFADVGELEAFLAGGDLAELARSKGKALR
jgi:hypothetical protein